MLIPNGKPCAAAGQDSYLSRRQLAAFRTRLLEWRQAVLAREHGVAADRDQDHGRPADPVDQGVEEVNQLRNLEDRLRNRKLLRQINAALERIEDGSYGYCLESGEEIGLRRLEVLPIATLSVEMQEELEHRDRARRLHQADTRLDWS